MVLEEWLRMDGGIMRGYVGERPANYAPHIVPMKIVIQTVESQTSWYKRLCELAPLTWSLENFKKRERFEEPSDRSRPISDFQRWREHQQFFAAFNRVHFEEQNDLTADDWDDHWSTLFHLTYGYRWEDQA